MSNKQFSKFIQQQTKQGKKENPITNKRETKVLSEAEKKQRSRRNIKVYDEAYFDVVALSQLKGMTHNELLIWLVKNAVKDLSEQEKSVFEYLRSTAEEASQKKNK